MNRVKINTVTSQTPLVQAKFSVKVRGNTHENTLHAIPDTGAETSVAGINFMKKMGIGYKDIRPPRKDRKLYAANNSEI